MTTIKNNEAKANEVKIEKNAKTTVPVVASASGKVVITEGGKILVNEKESVTSNTLTGSGKSDIELLNEAQMDIQDVLAKVEDEKKAKAEASAKKRAETIAKKKAELEVKKSEEEAVEEEVEAVPFKRTTRIEKSNVNKTIKSLFKNSDKLRFDLAIQRNLVWTLEQKSNLIHSILYGYPIPPVMVQDTNDDLIWFLDGKQRTTTIISYLNDEFALSKKTPDVIGHKIAGLKFKDLPEDMRDIIYDETVTLIKIKNLSSVERDEMFVRWNSGSALSKIELTRAKYSDLIEQINHISELDFFVEGIALSDTARNRLQDQEVILQIAMLLDKGRDNIRGFGSPEIQKYVLELKEQDKLLSKELVGTFETVSTYLNMASSELTEVERKKVLKKINIPIIFYTGIKALKEDKIKPSLFAEFLRDFLITNYSTETEYGKTSQKGSSKRESVVIRINEMNLAYEDFLEEAIKTRPENEIYKAKQKQR